MTLCAPVVSCMTVHSISTHPPTHLLVCAVIETASDVRGRLSPLAVVGNESIVYAQDTRGWHGMADALDRWKQSLPRTTDRRGDHRNYSRPSICADMNRNNIMN